VTAIDQKTQILPSSNFGTETVDLAAPGLDIVSTLPDNTYGKLTGTSQATAFVSGAAVLIRASKPAFSFHEVKKHILSTGDWVQNLAEKTKTSRQLNLHKALTVLDSNVTLSGQIEESEALARQAFAVESTSQKDEASRMRSFAESLSKTIERKLSSTPE
jgi:subtilisin family serine protease